MVPPTAWVAPSGVVAVGARRPPRPACDDADTSGLHFLRGGGVQGLWWVHRLQTPSNSARRDCTAPRPDDPYQPALSLTDSDADEAVAVAEVHTQDSGDKQLHKYPQEARRAIHCCPFAAAASGSRQAARGCAASRLVTGESTHKAT
jgi:hypothetical protein